MLKIMQKNICPFSEVIESQKAKSRPEWMHDGPAKAVAQCLLRLVHGHSPIEQANQWVGRASSQLGNMFVFIVNLFVHVCFRISMYLSATAEHVFCVKFPEDLTYWAHNVNKMLVLSHNCCFV